MAAAPYWPEVPLDTAPPVDSFRSIAATIPSPFFAMDLARTTEGAWTIIELGDGQVSGLPEPLDPSTFYPALAAALT